MSSQQCLLCARPVSATARVCPACGTPLGAGLAPGVTTAILPVGLQLVDGAFSVGRLLGRGGFGITYLGADNRLGRQIALKEFFPAGAVRHETTVVPPSTLAGPDYTAATRRFLREAQILARFQHQSIVGVYAVFEENATAYMVMEYLRGQTLGQRLERDAQPMAEDEIIVLARSLAEALDCIHAAGILHRDIKPENIILANGTAPARPVLIDFGAARDFVRGMTMRQSVVLTPGYAPLEQYGERAQRGPYTDIYAFAATLYHLATGVQPGAAIDRAVGIELKPPREINPRLSPAFERAILRGLEMKVEDRPQSAGDFFKELVSPRPVTGFSGRSSAPDEEGGTHKRAMPGAPPAPHHRRIEQIAAELARGEAVQTGRLRCPVCRSAAMVEPAKATGPIRCPVCRIAGIQQRIAPDAHNRCPVCRAGQLQPVQAGGLMRCPVCRAGNVSAYTRGRKLVVFTDTRAKCDRCDADFSYNRWQDTLTLAALPNGPGYLDPSIKGQVKTRGEWATLSGRTGGDMYACDRCGAELDEQPDGTYKLVMVKGRVELVPPAYRGRRLTQLEWSKIAHAIPPEDGTGACIGCGAQFDASEGDQLILVRAPHDPAGILPRYGGMPLPASTWRAIATGMRRPERPGCICPACTAELEDVGPDSYRLAAYDRARDPFGTGTRYAHRELRRDDWQRIAAGRLPAQEEQRLREEARTELWAGLLAGEIGDPAAEQSFPGKRAGGEQVLARLAAEQYKQNKDHFDRYDTGHMWITTKRLLFQGKRGNVPIPIDKLSFCGLQPQMGIPVQLTTVRRRDRARPLLFVTEGQFAATIGGLEVRLEWSVQHFVELVNSLRKQA